MPSFRMVMEAVVDAFERQREEIRERAAGTRERLGAIGAIEPRSEPPAAAGLEEAVAKLRAAADPQRGGFGGAPKFPPASALELLLAQRRRGGSGHRRAHPRRDGGRRHPRPARRRLRPLHRRRRLARPPLREDALRQRPAGPGLSARLAGARPRALPRRLRRHPGLDAGRDARPRGRLLLRPRRRLRGRGGPLLRLDPGPDPRGAGRSLDGRAELHQISGPAGGKLDAVLGGERGGELRGGEHPASGRGSRGARSPRGSSRCARRSTRPGPSASGRGSTTSASPPGTRWRSPRWPRPAPYSGARTTSTPPAIAPSSCSRRCTTATAASCARTRTATPASTPTSRTTPSCWRRC